MNPEFEAQFLGYLEARDAARADAVRAILAVMTKRERLLVWEVAVMAGVQGRMVGRVEPPKDSMVVHDAILGCLHMEDLYPTFQRLERIAQRRVERARQQ